MESVRGEDRRGGECGGEKTGGGRRRLAEQVREGRDIEECGEHCELGNDGADQQPVIAQRDLPGESD